MAERMMIKVGFNETIIDALLALIYFNPRNKKRLNPTTPVSPRATMIRNYKRFIRGNLPYFR